VTLCDFDVKKFRKNWKSPGGPSHADQSGDFSSTATFINFSPSTKPTLSPMSRRILAQTLQRSLRASRPTYLVSQQFHIPISSPQIKQLSPVSRFSTCSARFYATEDDSRGVPIQHSENEIKITPEEKERFELQKKAQ